jgi:Tfp pilus assembly protein PilF
VSATPPTRRNDPCPCGSGRRFKECHGKLEAAPPSLDAKIAGALQSHQIGNIDAAARVYREILAEDPAHAVATHYLGMVAWQRGDAREGERLMRASIAANATIPDFHNNLGLLLRDARRTPEAIACYQEALLADPSWFEAHNNLGLALEDAGRFDEALDAYRAAISGEPRFAAARQNLARLLITMGGYAEGWEEYRWRLLAQGASKMPPDAKAARFPPSLEGRRIALASEQGIGDVLFFLRFVPEVVARGAVVSFDGDRRLLPMLARTNLFAGGLGETVAGGEQVFIGDLPWLLAANDPSRFPSPLPLSPLPERVAAMRTRLEAAGPAPRIALTWRAGTATTGGPIAAQLKEVPLEALGQSLRERGATWIGIQRLPRDGETPALSAALGAGVHDFSKVNDDLEDMLALLALVDGYIGVSNANTHLRAGVDGSMSVLVPFPPEWRWSIAGDRSPWFPRMRVLRQEMSASWGQALASLASTRP